MLVQLIRALLRDHPEIVAGFVVKALRDEADKIEKDPSIVTGWVEQLLAQIK